jgi:hypothetical protein
VKLPDDFVVTPLQYAEYLTYRDPPEAQAGLLLVAVAAVSNDAIQLPSAGYALQLTLPPMFE